MDTQGAKGGVLETGGIPLGVKAGTTKKKKKKKVEGEEVEGAIVEEAILGKGMLRWFMASRQRC